MHPKNLELGPKKEGFRKQDFFGQLLSRVWPNNENIVNIQRYQSDNLYILIYSYQYLNYYIKKMVFMM